jgi:DNA-binding MarR family transcriptional regulator
MQRSVQELAVVLERLLRMLRRASTAGGLSMATASALARLERGGPLRLTELAVVEGVSQPAMTQLVGRLERDGLAARAVVPGDRRGVVVSVTPAGRELAGRRRTERVALLDGLVAGLAPGERAALTAAMPALTRLALLSDERMAADGRVPA